MQAVNKIPNKKIRTLLLGLIMLVYIITIVYIGFTKENNNLVENKNNVYTDKYSDEIEYYDESEYYDNYKYNQDDNLIDEELNVNSTAVTSLYSYIKLYPYVTNIKPNFKVAELTEEEKMRLVAASLKSKNYFPSHSMTQISETELILNNKTYFITTPNLKYSKYKVVAMYTEIFGNLQNIEFSTIMYDGDEIAYKYNETVDGYIKYVTQNQLQETSQTAKIIKAIKKSGKIEIYLEVGTQIERYIFEPQEGSNYIYKFTERITEQEKNSL